MILNPEKLESCLRQLQKDLEQPCVTSSRMTVGFITRPDESKAHVVLSLTTDEVDRPPRGLQCIAGKLKKEKW